MQMNNKNNLFIYSFYSIFKHRLVTCTYLVAGFNKNDQNFNKLQFLFLS